VTVGWCPRTAAIMSAVLPLGSVASTCAASSSSSELGRAGGKQDERGRDKERDRHSRESERYRARESERERERK